MYALGIKVHYPGIQLCAPSRVRKEAPEPRRHLGEPCNDSCSLLLRATSLVYAVGTAGSEPVPAYWAACPHTLTAKSVLPS